MNATAIENAGPYVEFSIEPTSYHPWQEGIFSPALEVRNGMVDIPEEPGWGVEINPAGPAHLPCIRALRRHPCENGGKNAAFEKHPG
jgi:L-alanine-DL-glutamate epimerase-like enolase superfamily enzyme